MCHHSFILDESEKYNIDMHSIKEGNFTLHLPIGEKKAEKETLLDSIVDGGKKEREIWRSAF